MPATITSTPPDWILVFSFRSLASGSSGNAYLLRSGSSTILIDAGLTAKKLARYLHSQDMEPGRLTAILISHEHRDHCIGARDLAREHSVAVWANADVLQAAGLEDLPTARVLPVGQPMVLGDVEVTAFPVQHDAVNPVGFSLRTDKRTVVVVTDLGVPSPPVCSAVAEADLVVIEANHDLELLHRGRYPYHLRARVSGPTGHLSNVQAARVLADCVGDDRTEVWLAHLSKENNSPKLAERTVRGTLSARGLSGVRVGIALRDKPSLVWDGLPRPRQLSLFPAVALGG